MPIWKTPNDEIVSFMKETESLMDVNSLIYENVSVWPFIRALIRYLLLSNPLSASIYQ